MGFIRLGQIAKITNGKRNAQDAVEDGIYPLFDRSSVVKRSNQYLFDKEALLVAGEGKTFLPKYYKGKFDLHQRCYAIFDIDSSYNVKYLYYYIRWNQPYFQSVYTGSTVPSLRLGNFTNMPIKEQTKEIQDKIVEELDNVEKNLNNKKNQLVSLDELIKSRFMCQEGIYAS